MDAYEKNDWVLFSKNDTHSFGQIRAVMHFPIATLFHIKIKNGPLVWIGVSAIRCKCTPDGFLLEKSKGDFNIIFDEMREI